MTDNLTTKTDPTLNVRNIVVEAVARLDDLREAQVDRINEKFQERKEYFDLKIDSNAIAANQRFEAQQSALKDALISQEKAVAAALEGTKEAINKADQSTDKRFDLLSEKIDGIGEVISKSSGAQGIYVTHTDLQQSLDKLQTNIEASLKPLVSFMNNSEGKSIGSNATVNYFFTALIAINIIIGLFFALRR